MLEHAKIPTRVVVHWNPVNEEFIYEFFASLTMDSEDGPAHPNINPLLVPKDLLLLSKNLLLLSWNRANGKGMKPTADFLKEPTADISTQIFSIELTDAHQSSRSGAWASKKQTCIIGSTIESEFVALTAAGKEAEWLRNLMHEISIWPKQITLISIHCDSASTLDKSYSQIYNVKSRHLGERLRKLRPEEAWETIEDLARYEEEEWNEPIFSKKGSPDYIDANLEQELESMEHRVESLMRSEELLYYEG
nr:zinc finger, CCHC-type [Tanacetum cinerariifolium]